MKQSTLLSSLIVAAAILSGLYFFPWKDINWGGLTWQSQPAITVTGYAETTESNQVATFYAGVGATNKNKEAALAEVNATMEKAIAAVKRFGVSEADIQTSNMSVYQGQEEYYEDGQRKYRPGDWNVNNSINIKLRNVEQASDLHSVLVESGLNNISGPNFSLDSDTRATADLISKAVDDARQKAESIARSQGVRLGELLYLTEGGASGYSPMRAYMEGGGGGAPTQPGSSQISTSVTATFAIE